jgi:hypothetical protein
VPSHVPATPLPSRHGPPGPERTRWSASGLRPPLACWPAPCGSHRTGMEAAERRPPAGLNSSRPAARAPLAGPVQTARTGPAARPGRTSDLARHLHFQGARLAARSARPAMRRTGAIRRPRSNRLPGLTQLPSHGHDTRDPTASHPSAPRFSSLGLCAAPHRPAGTTGPAGPARCCHSPRKVHPEASHRAGRERRCPSCGQNDPPAPCRHDAPIPARRDTPQRTGRHGPACRRVGALIASPGVLPRRPALADEPAQPTAECRSCSLRLRCGVPAACLRPDLLCVDSGGIQPPG